MANNDDSSGKSDMTQENRWKETRDLLKQALCDWESSGMVAAKEAALSREQETEEKERLEKLMHLLKEKMDELSF